jgi:photosystem II stability/assembly factor-like uncharacterized protein
VVSEFEKRLRASLHRHAAEAPDGDRLAERILRETSTRPAPSRRRRREWRAWTFPLATAGAVAAIAAALVGVHQVRHSAAPAGTQLPTAPQIAQPTPLPTGASQGTTVPTTTQAPAVPPSLTHVRVLDATFVGPDDGWLLATADCLRKAGTCTAMLRTTDGGAHWTSFKPPPANVPGVDSVQGVNACNEPCVDHIRFANAHTGYAYGPTGFFVTTNGGANWTQQGGGAVALETLDNNVIRLRVVDPGCGPPGCTYGAQTSAIGSLKWSKPYPLSVSGMTTGAQLVRGGNHDAYVLVTGHTAGGAANATSTLYVSTDDGATWSDRGEPCPQAGGPSGEVDSDGVAAGGDDRVSVLCVARMAPQPRFVANSSDHGAHVTKSSAVPGEGAGLLAGDPATVLLVGATSGAGATYRSIDGGRSWQAVDGVRGSVSWIGFESRTVGRIIGDNGRTIWATNDAGAHWTPFTFN